MELISAVVSALASYKVFNILTHPNSKIWNRFPDIKIKRFHFFPSIKLTVKGRVVHFHHWFNFSLLLCISGLVSAGILSSWVTRGVLFGGIVQGLSIPSARKLIYK